MNLKRLCHMGFSWTLYGVKNNVAKSLFGLLVFIALFVFMKFSNDATFSNIQKTCVGERQNQNAESGNNNVIDSADDISSVVKTAKRVSRHNGTVLVSVVNDAFLPFAYSWLCNTKYMNIHKSVLIITTDAVSKQRLNTDWPEVSVVKLNLGIPPGNQEYSRAGYVKIMIRRTEMLLELLMSDLEILLLEFDYMWFKNPIPLLQNMKGVDFLVNPVTSADGVFNGGFLYMFPTGRSKTLWKRLTEMMHALAKQLENRSTHYAVSENENDQIYFSALTRERYGNVTTRDLPLDTYADGKWYDLTDQERHRNPTLVISNNFVLGNANKMKRAKKWNHWFLRDDCTCDIDLVRKMVHR